MRFLLAIAIALLLVGAGCSQRTSESANDRKTQVFSSYLQEELSLSIPNQEHYYLIVHKVGCQGVIESALMDLNHDFMEQKNIAVITSNRQLVDKYFSDEKVKIYYDRTIDVINLPLYNVSLIKTSKKQVSYILSERKCSIDFGEVIKDSLTNGLP